MHADFQGWVADRQTRFEEVLRGLLPRAETAPHRLHEAMRYAVLDGGKRVRPLLAFAAGELAGADQTRVDVAAAAVELIHAYSLVHDDMPCMDDDVLRRGKPACHVQYDEATALLVGDALQTLAFQLLAEHRLNGHARFPHTRDTLLVEQLATRLGEPTTPAKSLVMAQPADCGSGSEKLLAGHPCEAAIPAPDAPQRRVMASHPNPLGETTSHSTRLQTTAAKSLVIPQAGNPHPNPLPEGEGSIALSPSGGKLDRGLGANESLREFHANDDAAHQLEMVRLLAVASGSRGMAGGQAIDLSSVGKALTLPELEFMHIHKTGALIRAAVLLGAHCGSASAEQLARLDHFGKLIGLAFQVVDDVLDCEADTATLGKTAGKDADSDKPTYVSLLGMQGARDMAQRLHREALETLAEFGAAAQRLRDLADFIVLRKF